MKKNITVGLGLLLLILLYMLSSCDFNTDRHLTGRYYLRHDESGDFICYRVDDDGGCVELINGAFGRIGYDDNFIIIERSESEYLIVTVYKEMNYFPEKGILGPFNLNDFKKQKLKLKIKADFTIDTN